MQDLDLGQMQQNSWSVGPPGMTEPASRSFQLATRNSAASPLSRCRERSGDTLQPSALVNEAYVRLAAQKVDNRQ